MSKLDVFQDEVNSAIRENKNDPIVLSIGSTVLNNIIRARRYNGRQFGSSKLYTDIILDNNSKSIKISLKEDIISSVSISKKAIDMMVPSLTDKFVKAASVKIMSLGLKEEQQFPDFIFGKVNRIARKKLIIGTQSMGGPIDYIYEGDTAGNYDNKSKTLVLQGNLINSEDYAEEKQLYLKMKIKSSGSKYKSEMTKEDAARLYDQENITLTDQYDNASVLVDIT